jgi:hypothetical protein
MARMISSKNVVPFTHVSFNPEFPDKFKLSIDHPLDPEKNSFYPYCTSKSDKKGSYTGVAIYLVGETPRERQNFAKKVIFIPPPFLQSKPYLGTFGDLGVSCKQHHGLINC